mgnify:CR=1 FL=1|tara:strand:+ start:993 stop:1367 length:375 start_codon:yes stop_codon:yes gene_type:complete
MGHNKEEMKIKLTEKQFSKIILGDTDEPSVTAMKDGLIKIVTTAGKTYYYELQAKTMFVWVGITVKLIVLATNVLKYLYPVTKEVVTGEISDYDKKMILNNVGHDIIGGLKAEDGTELRLQLVT